MKKQKKQRSKAKNRSPSGRAQPAVALDRLASTGISRKKAYTAQVRAAAVTSPYSQDDRQALTLLMLPFLIVAFAIGSSQALRWQPSAPSPPAPTAHHLPVAPPFARPTAPVANDAPVVIATAPPVANVIVETAPSLSNWPIVDVPPTVAATVPDTTDALTGGMPGHVLSSKSVEAPVMQSSSPNSVASPALLSPQNVLDPSLSPPVIARESSPAPVVVASEPAAGALQPSSDAELLAPSVTPAVPEVLALLVPEPTLPALPAPVTAPVEPQFLPENSCVREVAVKRTPAFFLGDQVSNTSIDPETFGRALATAARTQLDGFTVYTDKYQTLSYPMGDLPAFYGVCTDVIVRAYRELGVDLQQLVHQSKVGSGDTNIDHRRVTTLQKFFAKFGDELPITEFGEDYMPGDIVSYYRPQNAHSRTHIAIVSDMIGPSGQLMIIHNRGWGPQIEDGLFVDEITGHYRYSGAKRPAVAPTPVASSAKTAAPRAASAPSVVKKVKKAQAADRAGLEIPSLGSIQR